MRGIFGALTEFERSIIRERTTAGLETARARGRVGGRPRSLTEADLAVARTLLKDGDLTIAHVAERLGVAAPTMYAHLPRPRSTIVVDEATGPRSMSVAGRAPCRRETPVREDLTQRIVDCSGS